MKSECFLETCMMKIVIIITIVNLLWIVTDDDKESLDGLNKTSIWSLSWISTIASSKSAITIEKKIQWISWFIILLLRERCNSSRVL